MPTIEHVLVCAVRAARRPARGASATPSTHGPPAQRHCVMRDAPTHVVTLPNLPLTHLCPMVSMSKGRVCSPESLSGAALQAHRTRLGAQNCSRPDSTGGTAVARGAVLGWGGGRW
jgi:hypothetical protein